MDVLQERQNKAGAHLMPGYTVMQDGVEKAVWTLPTRAEINEMATPFFYAALDLWQTFKTCGMPHGGWANERATTVQIIRIFTNEANKYDAWKWEQEHPSED